VGRRVLGRPFHAQRPSGRDPLHHRPRRRAAGVARPHLHRLPQLLPAAAGALLRRAGQAVASDVGQSVPDPHHERDRRHPRAPTPVGPVSSSSLPRGFRRLCLAVTVSRSPRGYSPARCPTRPPRSPRPGARPGTAGAAAPDPARAEHRRPAASRGHARRHGRVAYSDGEIRQEWELIFLGRPVSGTPTVNDEASDVRWVASGDQESLDIHPTQWRQLRDWLTLAWPHVD
jgi:hypothetical protein